MLKMCKCAFPFAERMFDHSGISFDPAWRYSFRLCSFFVFFLPLLLDFIEYLSENLESRLLLLLKKYFVVLFSHVRTIWHTRMFDICQLVLTTQELLKWTFLTMRCGFECLMLSLLTRSRECGTLMEQQSQTIDSAKMFDFNTYTRKRAHHPNEPKI